MKYLCIGLAGFSLNATIAAHERRVRPLDPWAAESFERVIDRSALPPRQAVPSRPTFAPSATVGKQEVPSRKDR